MSVDKFRDSRTWREFLELYVFPLDQATKNRRRGRTKTFFEECIQSFFVCNKEEG
jgi:hypothetical protein